MSLSVEASRSVGSLKRAIFRAQRIDVKHQRLVVNGRSSRPKPHRRHTATLSRHGTAASPSSHGTARHTATLSRHGTAASPGSHGTARHTATLSSHGTAATRQLSSHGTARHTATLSSHGTAATRQLSSHGTATLR